MQSFTMPVQLAYAAFQEVDSRLTALIEDGEFLKETSDMMFAHDVNDHVTYANDLVKTYNFMLAYLMVHRDYSHKVQGMKYCDHKFEVPEMWKLMAQNA